MSATKPVECATQEEADAAAARGDTIVSTGPSVAPRKSMNKEQSPCKDAIITAFGAFYLIAAVAALIFFCISLAEMMRDCTL